MIKEFVEIWENNKSSLESEYKSTQPDSYDSIVTDIVKMINNNLGDHRKPDPERITIIDHGDYQGTRLYIIGGNGYQPSTYWSVFVDYGSCSGCDTFESISYGDSKVKDYMALALNILQSLNIIGDN
tara:strand:+ start:112 stop:492 length:381 start_codon:yes stop_codon:yes gene_type:complete